MDLRDNTLPLRRCVVGLSGCKFAWGIDLNGVMPPPFDRSEDLGTASGAAVPDLSVTALRTGNQGPAVRAVHLVVGPVAHRGHLAKVSCQAEGLAPK